MSMFNPPHPGEFIKKFTWNLWVSHPGVLLCDLRYHLRLFRGLSREQSAISPGMALRLAKCLGRSPESWLHMQDSYDLWQAKQTINLTEIEPLIMPA